MPIYNPPAGASGSVSIPERTSDPAVPAAHDAWVLRTTAGSIADGTPIGLLLGLTYFGNGGSSSYQFSYYTDEATIVRVTLT